MASRFERIEVDRGYQGEQDKIVRLLNDLYKKLTSLEEDIKLLGDRGRELERQKEDAENECARMKSILVDMYEHNKFLVEKYGKH